MKGNGSSGEILNKILWQTIEDSKKNCGNKLLITDISITCIVCIAYHLIGYVRLG